MTNETFQRDDFSEMSGQIDFFDPEFWINILHSCAQQRQPFVSSTFAKDKAIEVSFHQYSFRALCVYRDLSSEK